MSFENDTNSSLIPYALFSLYTLVLVPITYELWPSEFFEDWSNAAEFRMNPTDSGRPRISLPFWSISILIVLWVGFLMAAVSLSTIKVSEPMDPYEILGLDQSADLAEVGKTYRELSKKLHPDRGGSAEQFNRIALAYKALTDRESARNLEKYGHPDGPRAVSPDEAILPEWMRKGYSPWRLTMAVLIMFSPLIFILFFVSVS